MAAKRYRHGTERLRHPIDTLARIGPLARAAGVTRLADVTGLDRIGLPVFQAIRPLARSLSVSQGKGATRAAARVSALMEAIELHYAERIEATGPDRPATLAEAALIARVIEARGQTARFDPDRSRGWCMATDLVGASAIDVPRGLVSMDFARPLEPDLWPSSNGLASGNSRDEAIVAALCELIERDAHAGWLTLSPRARRATAIDIDTIDDRLGRVLLARVAARGMSMLLYDLSDAHGVPAMLCAIVDAAGADTAGAPPAVGAGCHPALGVALVRAVTEAAQSRATLIAGARDDIRDADYAGPGLARWRFRMNMLAFGAAGTRRWGTLRSIRHDDPAADRDWLISRMAAAGASRIACLDLDTGSPEIAVVKLVAPGLRDPDSRSDPIERPSEAQTGGAEAA